MVSALLSRQICSSQGSSQLALGSGVHQTVEAPHTGSNRKNVGQNGDAVASLVYAIPLWTHVGKGGTSEPDKTCGRSGVVGCCERARGGRRGSHFRRSATGGVILLWLCCRSIRQSPVHSPREKKAPRSHDLIEIIETAGFARLDLPPDLREYAETRSVELRYLMEAEATIDFDEEIRRAQNLSQWLRIRVNRLL